MSRLARKKKVRFNLTLTEAARDRLDKIYVASPADSYSEVVRRALAFYDLALDVEREGGRVVAQVPGDVDQRLVLEF